MLTNLSSRYSIGPCPAGALAPHAARPPHQVHPKPHLRVYLINMYMNIYIHTYTYKYIYTYLYTCVCVYIYKVHI